MAQGIYLICEDSISVKAIVYPDTIDYQYLYVM